GMRLRPIESFPGQPCAPRERDNRSILTQLAGGGLLAPALCVFLSGSNCMASQPFAGVLVPVLTPFTGSGEPDTGRFIAFCRWLLEQGADGLAIFGTTSEANSMAAGERMDLLDRLIAAGVPAAKLMPGTGARPVTEAGTPIKPAVGQGVGGRLVLPPFYYKGMSDDGI